MPGRGSRFIRTIAGTAAIAAAVTATTTVLSLNPRPTERAQASTTPAVAAGAAPACIAPASVARRAGLVLVVGLPGVTRPDDPLLDVLESMGVGGVMLRSENLQSTRQARTLVTALRDRLGQHVLVAVDEEGGRVTSLRALGGTTASARRLGKAGAKAARTAGEKVGEVASSVGIDWILGPVIDLDDGPAGGVIGDRSFGGDPDDVTDATRAYIAGLRSSGLRVTLKHFPGHGRADSEPHAGTTADHRSKSDLIRTDLVPFDALIDDGAEAVMVGHVIYPEIWGRVPASLTPGAYELLRARGFEGVAVTDALGMGAVYNDWDFDESPAMALAAGADALLVTQGDRVEELRDSIVTAVSSGDLDERRLDEAVRRVLDLRDEDPTGIVCP
ncbi:MAG: glycoside hydrolase family 3 N-terminal domain-containing protein [Microthrixaceae bacterium]